MRRMEQSGPYKYDRYRIIEATKAELIIKPACAGCGMSAGIDCQCASQSIFGRIEVTELLPIEFSDDHQFAISVRIGIDGKNFGKKKAKQLWFNSVRCAELFLIENGCCRPSTEPIGNGMRLAVCLGISTNPVKPKRGVRPSTIAKRLVWQNAGSEQQKSHLQVL